jgi:hypothetical protein
MSPKELSALAKVCQKHGITQLECGDIKLTIALGYAAPRPLTSKQLARDKELEEMGNMSDEDLALYSAAAGFDLTKDPDKQD